MLKPHKCDGETMSGLENLKTRLEYHGGVAQEGRMQQAKLNSLRKSLLYSYQAATAVIDGKMFRCLMNPNKQKADYDCKILSIPYEDICIGEYDAETKTVSPFEPIGKTNGGKIPTRIEAGRTFLWKETDTHWIVYLKFLEEDAYFRGEVYKCEDEPITINGHEYYVYIRGPVETTIQWNIKDSVTWNDLNYSLIMYITQNEETLDYFHRFQKLKIGNEMWEVKTVDPYSADGIIEVCLGEWYNNEFEEEPTKKPDKTDKPIDEADKQRLPHIDGPTIVQPYDIIQYSIKGLQDGKWIISNNKKARFVNREKDVITIEIITGKSGEFNLTYENEEQSITLPIEIKSL